MALPMVALKNGVLISYHDELRVVFLADTADDRSQYAKFSVVQYPLLTRFLTGEALSDEELLQTLQIGIPTQEDRLMLRRIINNIRAKLRPLCLNIYRIALYGYILLPDRSDQGKEAPDQRKRRVEGEAS